MHARAGGTSSGASGSATEVRVIVERYVGKRPAMQADEGRAATHRVIGDRGVD